VVSSPYYDNQHWEYHLPVNPPIDPANDCDVSGVPYVYPWHVDQVSIVNWNDPFFEPRLRDNVQLVARTREAADGEADELDMEYDD
jgi:hypothetical protein